MKKIYLAGAIKKDPNYRAKFTKKEVYLKAIGHEVINPCMIDTKDKTETQILIECLQLQASCDVTYFLSDYHISNGAMVEFYHSKSIEQDQMFEDSESLDSIVARVMAIEDVSLKEMKGKSRIRHIVEARQIYSYIARKKTNATLTEIGDIINRDHTTVIHSLKQVRDVIEMKEKLENYE